jgi:hypothetical protein
MNISNTECSLNHEHHSLVLFMGFYGLLIIESIYLCIKRIWILKGWMKN